MRFALIILVGACLGGILGYVGSCTTGTCPLTANPWRGAGFGALLGFLFAMADWNGSPRRQSGAPSTDRIVSVAGLQELQTMLAAARVPVLVAFTADWCGPCKRLKPELSALAEDCKDAALLVSVNVDRQRDIAQFYDVSSIPDVRIFRDGRQVEHVVGYRSQAALQALLDTQ